MKNVQQFEPGLLPTYAVIPFLSVPSSQFPVSLLFSGGGEECKSGCTWTHNANAFRCCFSSPFPFSPRHHFSRRYKWHCNIISVENTSKCNPALHVCGDTLSGHKHKHTHSYSHTHTHVQSLWLVSICVYICACIC